MSREGRDFRVWENPKASGNRNEVNFGHILGNSLFGAYERPASTTTDRNAVCFHSFYREETQRISLFFLNHVIWRLA